MKINKIIINGIEQKAKAESQPEASLFTILKSYQIKPGTRGESDSQEIDLEDEDLVELVFDDGTTWFSSPDTLEDIFPEAARVSDRSGETRFVIPGDISAETTERGQVAKAILKAINILSKKDKKTEIEKLAAEFEDKQLEGKTGLFRLDKDFQLLDYKPKVTSEPYCVLIHGTASSIAGSFDKAKATPVMDFLMDTYGDRLLAFQHRTLTLNPLENTRDLIKALPDKATLHIITTSRGGLVGEVLSRFCQEGKAIGFTDPELGIMKKHYPKRYFDSLVLTINEIISELSKKKITVEKFIRLACPAGGTTLASKRLDHLLNVSMNLLRLGGGAIAGPVLNAFRDLVGAAVETKNDVYLLPGLEAQNPASPFILALNSFTGNEEPSEMFRIDNSLVVIAGNARAGFQLSALWVIATRLFFRQKNDLVVDTASMSLGTRRSGLVQEYRYEESDIDHFSYFKNENTRKAIQDALVLKWGERLPDFSVMETHYVRTRDFDLAQHAGKDTPLGRAIGSSKYEAVQQKPLQVSISMGDLFYAKYPIIAGHFEDDGILYAEKAINDCLNGALNQKHQIGIYPGKVGTSDVYFPNSQGFNGAIIVGMGKREEFTASELTKTVEQGTANYLLQLRNRNLAATATDDIQKDGISALIVGCGFGGLSIESSIRAIIQGITNAKIKVENLKLDKTPPVEHLEFVELYEDKAVSSLFSISKIANEETNSYKIVREGKGIKSLLGFKTRIPADATEGWWNRITVTKKEDDNKVVRCLKFKTSTNSAREEEQELYTSPSLLDEIIKDFSVNNKWTEEKAKTIFELMIPNDFKDNLKRHGNIIWVLDHYTASYPWELLQDGLMDTKPLCVSAGMIRQLSTTNYRRNIKTVPQNFALVIADPDLHGFAGQLPGAREEGEMVVKMLDTKNILAEPCVFKSHSEIIRKLSIKEYKILHLSGHGVFNSGGVTGSGMVIGKDKYLSVREIVQMSYVPELVFVNCCHLGNIQGEEEEFFQQSFKMAANIGTQLIENGVKCVIAAGWAVNDTAALEFARVFYEQMLDRKTFGEAVKEARKVVFEKFESTHTNTWGAYQCYGDPFYKFENIQTVKKNGTKSYLIEQEAIVELENLLREVEVNDFHSGVYADVLNDISAAINNASLCSARIYELEANIYLQLKEYEKSCQKFESLLQDEKADFSFSAMEKYCNARAKQIIAEYKADSSNEKVNEYHKRMNKVIGDMELLIGLGPTSERYNILGSTYKRKAFISKDKEKINSMKMAADLYFKGYSISNKWYPLVNWLTLVSILGRSGNYILGKNITNLKYQINYTVPDLNSSLEMLKKVKKMIPIATEKLDYWDMIADINMSQCEYILNFSEKIPQQNINHLLSAFNKLWFKAGSLGKKEAEIENLELIIDALSTLKNKDTGKLGKDLDLLRTELEKMA